VVSYLPRQCFSSLIDDGKLVEIVTEPALPAIPYVAIYRSDRPSNFTAEVAEWLGSVCDYRRQFQA